MKKLVWNDQEIAIIASKKDIASSIIAAQVEKLRYPVFYLEDKSFLNISDIDLPLADIYIILSRHSSAAGEPAFTVHSVGNFSSTEPKLGGKNSTLGTTQADVQTYLLYSIFKIVEQHKEFSHFDIVSEATHHGPLITKPLVFLEMGSNNDIWTSTEAANILAWSINYFFKNYSSSNNLQGAIGFGGGHYPIKISESMLHLEFAVGHICPKYSLQFLNEDLISQMIRKSQATNSIKYALFDKKGMNRKQEIREIVTKYGLEVKEL